MPELSSRWNVLRVLTHEHLDFTLLEALASWTLASVVAAEEESMFDWMSSVVIKQNNQIDQWKLADGKKNDPEKGKIVNTNNNPLLMNENSKVLENVICLSNLLLYLFNTLFPFLNYGFIEGNFIIKQNYSLPAFVI